MSGGYFNYEERRLETIAEKLREAVNNAQERGLSDRTVREFKRALRLVEHTYAYLHRIDYFLSADDSEETFHEQLLIDLLKIEL